ncbi:unnamed protein product [Caenorhabditis auriculariae]|uniref:RPGRIP1 C-terminal domain-containing protein n=1 Tax=Caenorhabditis auriculariae TaxID=2777116 RepID=A0A8S1HGS2_9PELO|nr:unnamed protein product [Caenorhabditis auriculariae]
MSSEFSIASVHSRHCTIEAPEEEAVSPSSSTSSEQIKRSDEIRSLLGNLPPIAKPRTSVGETDKTSKSMDSGGRNVLFTDPLHRSIPPSETSSVSSPRQNERQPVALPDSGGRSAIRHTSTSSQFEEEGNESGGALVTLWIEKFEVMDYSRLLLRYFDNTKVYVDWTFLDFPVEESKTNEFSLPRVAGEEAPIQFKKEYRLTRRRVALLKQWIELGNRVDFTLLIGGSEEEELGVAQLQLFTDPLEETTSISFLDVNGEHLAELHLALHYSPSIFDDV